METLSVEVNREAMHAILDGSTAIVNGKVVAVSEEGSIVVIEEEVTVTFENSKVIANGEVGSEAEPSSAVSEGEAVSKVVVPVSVEVNGESVAVTFDGTASLVNHQQIIATEGGLLLDSNGEEVSVTFDGTNVIVNGEEVGVSETVGESAVLSGVGDESVDG